MDCDPLRLRYGRVAASGLAPPSAAGLHHGIQLFIGLGLLFGAVFIANPTIVAPAFNTNVPDGYASDLSAALRDHRMRCNIGVPWPGLLRHNIQAAAEQGDRRTFCRLSGFVG